MVYVAVAVNFLLLIKILSRPAFCVVAAGHKQWVLLLDVPQSFKNL
jgi:hypothetical protein